MLITSSQLVHTALHGLRSRLFIQILQIQDLLQEKFTLVKTKFQFDSLLLLVSTNQWSALQIKNDSN